MSDNWYDIEELKTRRNRTLTTEFNEPGQLDFQGCWMATVINTGNAAILLQINQATVVIPVIAGAQEGLIRSRMFDFPGDPAVKRDDIINFGFLAGASPRLTFIRHTMVKNVNPGKDSGK